MLGGRLLAAAGIAVPHGALTVAPVQTGERLKFAQNAAGATLSGVAHRVPWGNLCAHAVVAGELDGKAMVGLVSTSGAARGVNKNLAGEPRALLEFDRTPLLALAALTDALARLEAEGALYRSVQMAGALERSLEYSLQYANERVQFGRPIARFQAIQHMLAVLAGQVAASSAAADAAVEASSRAPDEFAVSVAKARVGEARQGRRNRASGAWGDGLHARAQPSLQHAPPVVVAGRVRQRKLLAEPSWPCGRSG
jgi:hypothetical protein